jgi:hypothetical protein
MTHREDRSQSGRVEQSEGRALEPSASRTVVAGPDRLLLRHAELDRGEMRCDSVGAAQGPGRLELLISARLDNLWGAFSMLC